MNRAVHWSLVIWFPNLLHSIFECEQDYRDVRRSMRVLHLSALTHTLGFDTDDPTCRLCHSEHDDSSRAFFAHDLSSFIVVLRHDFPSVLGALSYTAPEVFRSETYTVSSDIYSFGCILLDMITCDTLTVGNGESDDQSEVSFVVGWRNITITYLCSTWSEHAVWNTAATANGEFLSIPLLHASRFLYGLDKRDDIQTNRSNDDSRPEKTSRSRVRSRGRGEHQICTMLICRDLKTHDYVIESMHAIDSDRMKYPAKRDVNWTRNGISIHSPRNSFSQASEISRLDLAQNGKLEVYLNYLKQHRNAESRVEYALHLCSQSKSVGSESRWLPDLIVVSLDWSVEFGIALRERDHSGCGTLSIEYSDHPQYLGLTEQSRAQRYHSIIGSRDFSDETDTGKIPIDGIHQAFIIDD